MNNVDRIIKYLSGDLNQEEMGLLERELAEDQALKAEFDRISEAFDLIRDQLQRRDEDTFKQGLQGVMEHSDSVRQAKSGPVRKALYFLVPLAACAAILLVVFLSPPNDQKLYTRYFHPENDEVLLSFIAGTRGRAEFGIVHYRQGNYVESRKIMQELMEEDPENLLARVYYLLASMETGNQEEALQELSVLDPGLDHQLGQALCWYTALAQLKSDQTEAAAEQLDSLISREGPYRSDALKLQKRFLK